MFVQYSTFRGEAWEVGEVTARDWSAERAEVSARKELGARSFPIGARKKRKEVRAIIIWCTYKKTGASGLHSGIQVRRGDRRVVVVAFFLLFQFIYLISIVIYLVLIDIKKNIQYCIKYRYK